MRKLTCERCGEEVVVIEDKTIGLYESHRDGADHPPLIGERLGSVIDAAERDGIDPATVIQRSGERGDYIFVKPLHQPDAPWVVFRAA